MVDSADLGFYGAAWRFTDFCQHLYARSVYLQLVLKSCELPGLFRSSPRSATRLADVLKLARVPLSLVATLATLPSISEIPFLDCSIATIVVAGALCPVCHASRAAASTTAGDDKTMQVKAQALDLCQELFLADGARSDEEDAVLQDLRELLE